MSRLLPFPLPMARAMGAAVSAVGASATGAARPASAVNVNGATESNDMQSSQSPSAIDGAIGEFLAGYRADGASAVATIVATAKVAADARKGMQAGLFAGFLALAASGASGAVVRSAGAAIRSEVAKVLRVRAGFPAVKAKGSKEKGAPDFSTASVYAGTVAAMLAARAESPSVWEDCIDALDSASETGLPMDAASGFPAAISACKRALSAYDEATAARMAADYPALSHQDPSAVRARTVEELEAENAALRARVAQSLVPGDVGTSLATARAERDSALSDVAARDSELSQLRARVAQLEADLAAATV